MKVGDLVKPRLEWEIEGIEYGIGVIVDLYYDDVGGQIYYYVSWKREAQWWIQDELELISEKK